MDSATVFVIFLGVLTLAITGAALYTALGPGSENLEDPLLNHSHGPGGTHSHGPGIFGHSHAGSGGHSHDHSHSHSHGDHTHSHGDHTHSHAADHQHGTAVASKKEKVASSK